MAELERLPDATLITVRCVAATLGQLGSPAGLTFPREANRFTTHRSTRILWAGPDDWLIVDERPDASDLLAALERAFAGHHAAVVEVSGNRVRFRISGPDARALMNRACALDFDPPHFATGQCAGTIVARAQAFVMQTGDDPTYELLVRRSFAAYLAGWFVTARRALPSSSAAPPSRESGATPPRRA